MVDSGANEGLIFHEGSRLTDLKIKQSLSIDYPRLEPLHHLKIELMFHFFKIRNTWTLSHWSTLAIGFLATILSGWDFGIGELSGGGNFNEIGTEGVRSISKAAIALTLISTGLWAILLVRLWSIFPLMRSQAISLYVIFIAAQISQFQAHGVYHNGVGSAIALAAIGLLLITFVCFILLRAVTETRDLHVVERHYHPDPRQVEIARRDHSLIAWSFALVAFCVLAVFHAWAGAQYVSVRQPGDVSGWWILKMLHLVSGLMIVWLMVHVLWYPQIMLGSADMRIESDRARQVGHSLSSEAIADANKQPARSGKCPDCGEITPVKMRSNGEISAACAIEGCNGSATPGDKCSVCGTRISSRIICKACNTSAPLGNHFADEEAW